MQIKNVFISSGYRNLNVFASLPVNSYIFLKVMFIPRIVHYHIYTDCLKGLYTKINVTSAPHIHYPGFYKKLHQFLRLRRLSGVAIVLPLILTH